MTSVFLDTVGLLALWDSSDQWHEAASNALAKLGSGVVTVTTSFIMLECGNAASRRPYRHLVDALRINLEQANKLIVPTESDWGRAWQEYRLGKAGDAGIVDYISFIVMRRLGISDAFTNDRHFRAAGFNTLF